jgi:hypothetical protein
MKLLTKIRKWWRGDADPEEVAEAQQLREEDKTRRMGARGPRFGGGVYGREGDFRDR